MDPRILSSVGHTYKFAKIIFFFGRNAKIKNLCKYTS